MTHEEREQEVHARTFLPLSEIVLDRALDLITSATPETLTVLDLGCGIGGDFEILHDRKATIYGVDSDPVALEIAKTNHTHIANLSLEQRDVNDDISHIIPGTYDLVLLKLVLAFADNPEQLLSQVKTKLAAQGKLLLITPVELEDYPVKDNLKRISVRENDLKRWLENQFDNVQQLSCSHYGRRLQIHTYLCC